MTLPAAVIAAVIAVGAALLSGCQERSLEAVEAAVRREFPEVAPVTTEVLAQEIAAGRKPVLLDVRTAEEYAVSHLKNARQIDPGAVVSALADIPADAEIVTYCSVGYRSARLAGRLRKAGYQNVRNLQGSIFQWANEGRPVYRGGEQVIKVHPYDAVWGHLLDADRRSGSGS